MEVTRLLNQWQNGDAAALDDLVPLVYDELRKIARSRMRAEKDYQTLEPTALLHEMFLLLRGQQRSRFVHRGQFYSLANKLMRRVLIDHARFKKAQKRGGDARPEAFKDGRIIENAAWMDPLLMEDALVYLAEVDTHLRDLAELKLFGGFDMREISEILDLTLPTAYRHWKMAKAHLYRYFRKVQ